MEATTLDRAQILDVDLYGAVKRAPYRYYLEWNQRPPFYIMVEGHPQAVFTRQADTRAVLEDYTRFSSVKRPYPGTQGFYFFNAMPSVTDSDPPVHTRRRRLMAPALTPRRLMTIEAGVNDCVNRLLDEIETMATFDAVADLGRPLALQTLLGMVCDLPQPDWPIFTGLMAAQRAAFNQLAVNEGAVPRQHQWHRFEVVI
jgi:cytochrome P450